MAARLRLVFMGTAEFGVPVLAALIEAGHDIVCVYSQPPRPAGRGRRERPSGVHAFAAGRAIEVRTPATLKEPDAERAFAALNVDAAVVAAYGLILPAAILAAPRLGCFNVHASLLPRWRGAAPIQRALMAGDEETGVTIMRMNEGLDTGPIVLAQRVPIAADATAGELQDQLAAQGARLIVEALDGIAAGRLAPADQPTAGVTYARKLAPDEERIDWTRPATEIERRVRALAPRPGAWCLHRGGRLKVLVAEVAEPAAPDGGTVASDGLARARGLGAAAPGTVLDTRLTVACGRGALRLKRVQRAGKAAVEAEAFLRGHPLAPGEQLA